MIISEYSLESIWYIYSSTVPIKNKFLIIISFIIFHHHHLHLLSSLSILKDRFLFHLYISFHQLLLLSAYPSNT